MASFEEAVASWTCNINEWYRLNATCEEVTEAFNRDFKYKKAYDGTSYVEMFFKTGDDPEWTVSLDTADREGLADSVESLRGRPPLPTYADLGGNLMNKIMKYLEYEKHHILDFCMEDDELSNNDREIRIFVDTFERVHIEIGDELKIRTNADGLLDLQEGLERAFKELERINYEKITSEMSKAEDSMIDEGISAREKAKKSSGDISQSEQQLIDGWNSNDPVNW